MNKFYIVENLEFDPKFKTEKEIEDLKFKRDQAIGVSIPMRDIITHGERIK